MSEDPQEKPNLRWCKNFYYNIKMNEGTSLIFGT